MKPLAPPASEVNATTEPAREEIALPPAPLGNPRPAPGWLRLPTPRILVAAILLLGLLGVAFLVYPQLQAWRHLSAARAAIQKNHNLEAIRHLQICLKTWPNDAEVLFLAARTARRAGAYGEAEQALEKYEAQRGSDELAALERILLRAENGEMNEVDGFCKHWIENGHPDAPFIFEASVRGYLQAYRLSDAWRCVQRWRQEQPNNPQTYYLEGQIHDCSGVSWAALEAYQKVLQADPEHEEARLKLTAALMERRSFTEAVPHLEHLLQHMPDEPLVPVRLALCRDILGQTDEAVRILDELLARQPHCAPALVERGKIALNRGQYEQAESWLREAVALAPGEHEARYQLVQCLRRAGKDAEAQQEDQRLSRLEIDLRRMDEITNLRMSQAPNDPALHGELGAIMLRNGFVEQGMHWLQSALKLDGRCPPAHQALAEYYQQLGDAEKAENHRRLAGIPAPAGGTKPSPTR